MRTSRVDWCGILIVLIMTLALAAMSFLAIMPLYSQNICFADSSDGVVEDNILLNSEFFNFNNLIVNNSQYTTISSYNPLRFSSSANWGYVAERHPLSYFDMTQTVTFTVRIRSVGGQTVLIGGRTYNSSGNSITSLGTRTTSSSTFVNLSITYDLSSIDLTNVAYLGFCYYCNGSGDTNKYCEIEWAKVEYGSSFTGFVPKSYSNYGYEQGYAAGLQYSQTNYQIKSGFSLIGSVDDTLGFVDDQASSMATGMNFNMTWQATGTIDSVYYYDFTYVNYNGNIVSFCKYQPLGGSVTAYPDGSYNVHVNASGVANTAAAFYIGTYEQTSFNFYLFGNLSDTYVGLLVVQADDHSNVRLLIPEYNYNFGDTKAFRITGLRSGLSYELYLVKLGLTGASQRVLLPNSALDLNGMSVLTGYGYYTIYAEVNSYEVGVNAYDKGYNDGFNTGYGRGYAEGDNAGFNRGVDSATDYGFYGLIGSAIDVPISAITGLLDFDLLGVNMKAFFLSIFSLAVLIVIVRLIVGGLS